MAEAISRRERGERDASRERRQIVDESLREVNLPAGTSGGGAVGGSSPVWGGIAGTLSNQTDLKTSLDLKADLVGGKVPANQLPTASGGSVLTAGINVFDFIPVAEHAAIKAGTSVYDCRADIQAAIDFSIFQGGKDEVIIPPGIFNCNGPIHMGYGTDYCSITLRGAGSRFRGESGFNGTSFNFLHNNAPGVVIQGTRAPKIIGLTIKGKNFDWIETNELGKVQCTQNDLDPLLWIDPALPVNSNSRFTPYAGVAIDPYSGPRPSVSYPDVVYPAFVGTSVPQYNKAFSSNVFLDDVEIIGWVVNVAQQPCDADGNADYTKLHRCFLGQALYNFSAGNGQSRLIHFLDCTVVGSHTGVVTTKHGRQNGKPIMLFTSCDFGSMIQWLDIPNTNAGAGPQFVNCYAEATYRIGNVGVGAIGNGPTSFTHCEFSFHLQARLGRPTYIFEANGVVPIKFDSCGFATGDNSLGHFAFKGQNSKQYSFVNCVVICDATQLYEKFAMNATAGITVSKMGGDFETFVVQMGYRWDLNTGASTSPYIVGDLNDGRRPYGLPYATNRALAEYAAGDPGVAVRPKTFQYVRSGAALTTVGREVTFDTAYPDWAIIQRGFGVGDVVWDAQSGATFYVRARTGSVITLKAVTGYNGSGALITPVPAVGEFYVINSRVYSPGWALRGSLTSGSTVVTNVHRGDGVSTWLTTELAIGDQLYSSPHAENFINETAAAITAIDQAAQTITFASGLNFTDARARLPLLIRSEAPNGT